MWLQFLGLPDYQESFEQNQISGLELLELTDSDLVAIEVRATRAVRLQWLQGITIECAM